ncbi:uncharacterized protein TRIADDRAFT_29160 [Trichoplax adhaerens]|uniref:Flavin-containing monooxygenase n=1 Tax=Trichoplax adhaerens TaxID=10228 RepID=B3S5B6_TRIAD|nr:hypothetical protein TRIADDRAFT_29160 [Trichoplax adhaerens]EDV22234.1 hypothetical protein TRIADDRAFT_29160 [Trichoplax adhaerens]|eukprot:XP_002115389.1 hypothetical protein TRIADDRAFT_29160 [Trichoplax adhaerens]
MKVAIIGAGASGLTSLKECIDEGIEGVVLEKENYIGGLWRFSEEVGKGGTVYRSTIINTSKELMCFSDFPIPASYSPFMHNTGVIKYFEMYAEKFDLYKHIRYNTFVHQIKQASDYDQTGRWDIVTSPSDDHANKTTTTYDGVMVCSGHHWDPRMPSFKGMDVFKGKQMHSHDYKDYRGFENKRVVVVGIGNSAVDVACETSHHASKVFLSTRRGTWVFSRLGPGGQPIDHVFNRFINAVMPTSMLEAELKKGCEARFNHEHYGLKTSYRVLAQHPTMSDELPVRIICGSVKVKDNVESLTEHDVTFTDGTVEKDIDVIVYSTGYKFGFPFLDPSIVEVVENKCDLYKYVFPPHLKHATLAMVGFVQPVGAIMPISEMQARWVTRVFNKKSTLPSEAEMMADITGKRDHMASRYTESPRHTIEVDFIPFMDELATLIGCKPSFLSMFFTDPKLAFQCCFGPCTPPQYRLQGPHSWKGAKKAIESVDNNVINSMCTRQVKAVKSRSGFFTWFVLLGIIMVPLAYAIYRSNGDIGGAVSDIG